MRRDLVHVRDAVRVLVTVVVLGARRLDNEHLLVDVHDLTPQLGATELVEAFDRGEGDDVGPAEHGERQPEDEAGERLWQPLVHPVPHPEEPHVELDQHEEDPPADADRGRREAQARDDALRILPHSGLGGNARRLDCRLHALRLRDPLVAGRGRRRRRRNRVHQAGKVLNRRARGGDQRLTQALGWSRSASTPVNRRAQRRARAEGGVVAERQSGPVHRRDGAVLARVARHCRANLRVRIADRTHAPKYGAADFPVRDL